MTGLNLYHREEGWVVDICAVESEFLHTAIPVEMLIEWTEGIVELGIIRKEFL